jgi:penicillin-binding protein 1A
MKSIRDFFRNIVLGLISLSLAGIICGGIILYFVIIQLPDTEQLKDAHLQVPLRVYTSDGKLIGEFGDKRRTPVTLNQIPKQLIRAVIDTEDQRFYEHPGVDIIGLARAAKELFITGKKTQGASTITMQVARNFFLSPEKTYVRKFKEILLAIKIDHEFSKNDILQLYLNKVYFGQSAYGVAAAAKVYYGKTLDQLILAQIAMIAGLPQAPSRDNPIINPNIALERRNHVLKRMLEQKDIDQPTYEQAVEKPITASYHGLQPVINAPYVAEMVRNAMFDQFGDTVYDQGLKVYTTIDSRLQKIANKSLHDGLLAYSKRHGYIGAEENLGPISNAANWHEELQNIPTIGGLQPAVVTDVKYKSATAVLANGNVINIKWPELAWAKQRLEDGYVNIDPQSAKKILKVGDIIRVQHKNNNWQLTQIPQANGALVVINAQNGAILSLDGGFSFAQIKFNCATQADRQPGSSFKPFIYSAALAKGYTLASIINDAPVVISDTGANSLWRPENVNKKFYGPTRLRIALTKSRNLVSIRLLQNIGIPYTINYIKRFGFKPKNLPASLSLALGTALVSPLELTIGYAMLANGGYRVYPFLIDHVTNEKGETIYQAEPDIVPPAGNAVRVISAENAYLITDAMKSVIRHGTGKKALALRRSDLAGKTGTTNQQMDAWFAGFNTDIVATVWMGFNQPQSLYEYGQQAALPIWIDFMRQALKGTPQNNMLRPANIVTVRIDPKTGLLAYPGQNNAVFELFRKQYVPTETAERPDVGQYSNSSNSNLANINDNELF